MINGSIIIRFVISQLPFTNEEGVKNVPLDDLQALFIGIVRDDLDGRLFLTGNMRYEGRSSLRLPAVSINENNHYSSLDRRDADFRFDLKRKRDQWEEYDLAAGALTTRSWAKAYYSAGTNRRPVKQAIDLFLCTPIDVWKFRGLDDFFVRRDVDRTPSGNPLTYQNKCRNCHATMDGMSGAFARMDFVDDKYEVLADDEVAGKYNINANFYPAGYVPSDNSWVNFLVQNPNLDFGFRTPTQGSGVVEFAKMLSESKGFSQCMAKRVFETVCGKELSGEDVGTLLNLADSFETNDYNFKSLFTEVALNEKCISRE